VNKVKTSAFPFLENVSLRGYMAQSLPLARYTRWRVGGEADLAFFPIDVDDLQNFLSALPSEMPLTILGLGSNVLIRDKGIRGAVVFIHEMKDEPIFTADGIYAPAGLSTPKLARFAAQHHCIDAAFLVGIPGTVGGALAMNAGCHGDEIWRHVRRVEVMRRDGERISRLADEYQVGYRHVHLLKENDSSLSEIFIGVWLAFQRDEKRPLADNLADIKRLLARRAESQPQTVPNAGSVFRNPPNDYAGRLIEEVGLKAYSIGGAQISEKHANFIINPQAQASAADIEVLIEYVQQQVYEKKGIQLIPEVRIIGEK
jgi:UDP-N-acetylenolpyruvoylglucosamine reductase